MSAEGVPVTQLAAQLGHAKNSLTLDVYGQRSHELKLGHDVALVWPRASRAALEAHGRASDAFVL